MEIKYLLKRILSYTLSFNSLSFVLKAKTELNG